MRIQVPKKYLADVLGNVEKIIPSKSSSPGLSLIKLDAKQGVLTLSGSNMDMDIRARINADIEGEGTISLPAQVFGQVVRALPGELVELEVMDQELAISSGSYATKLQLSDVGTMPDLSFPEIYGGSIDATTLAHAVSSVRYAAALAEYQAIFRGVKLELTDAHTRAVATDGFRLAYYTLSTPTGLAQEVVIPARSVEELSRLLQDGDAELDLTASQLSVRSGYYQLNVKLMEGEFPDYERVIPNQFVVSITTSSKSLLDSVTRVAVMADKTTNNRIDLFVKDGTLQITAEGGYGRSQEALEVSQEGSEGQIVLAYNSKYLEDALKPIEGEVRLSFSGTTSPSVLTSSRDPNYVAMVVPLRTS